MSTTASAYDFEVDGLFYSIVSSTDLTCEVIHGDITYAGDIIIPSSVTYDNRNLSVTKIGSMAFCDCTDLASVSIPNSVKEIGSYAFSRCSSLTSAVIPNSLKIIREMTFCDCTSLLFVSIPNSVIIIEQDAFNGYNALTSVSIPDSVTEIGSGAFYNCI